jgi:hypothetical protein
VTRVHGTAAWRVQSPDGTEISVPADASSWSS